MNDAHWIVGEARFALAKAMKEVTRRTDACWRPVDVIQHQFAGAPFGSAYACISRGEQGQYPSSNHNRLHLYGVTWRWCVSGWRTPALRAGPSSLTDLRQQKLIFGEFSQ